jgi:hypothetical protein
MKIFHAIAEIFTRMPYIELKGVKMQSWEQQAP